MAYTDCKIEVKNADKVGKTHEHKNFVFEIPEHLNKGKKDEKEIQKYAQKLLDEEGEGYVADGYFGSKDSFFKENGKQYAKIIARKWV